MTGSRYATGDAIEIVTGGPYVLALIF